MQTLVQNKSIGLKITYQRVAGFPKGRKRNIILITIAFHESASQFSYQIDFEQRQFLRYCRLLEKTASKSEAIFRKNNHMLTKMFPKLPIGDMNFYGGIIYYPYQGSQTAQLSLGHCNKNSISESEAEKIKSTRIDTWFDSLVIDLYKSGFDKKKKIWNNVSSPVSKVFFSLSRYAFLKFRSSCLQAATRLRNIKQ